MHTSRLHGVSIAVSLGSNSDVAVCTLRPELSPCMVVGVEADSMVATGVHSEVHSSDSTLLTSSVSDVLPNAESFSLCFCCVHSPCRSLDEQEGDRCKCRGSVSVIELELLRCGVTWGGKFSKPTAPK